MSDDKTFTQADVDRIVGERLQALKDQHKTALQTVRDELAAATTRWKEAEPRLAKVAELEAEIGKRDRSAMFTAAGITDEATQTKIAKWFDVAREDYAEAERPDLATWIKEHAPNDPVVGGLFKKPADPAAPAQRQAPAMPNTGANAKPPPPPAPKLTEADIKKGFDGLMAEARRHPVGSQKYAEGVESARAYLRNGGTPA